MRDKFFVQAELLNFIYPQLGDEAAEVELPLLMALAPFVKLIQAMILSVGLSSRVAVMV
ncbi:hypothetical protein KR52_13005 [Synechococcus sp. KORDI-52]|nr:hypothetical protein KR52_13005 [Synechococcus sp. KORDI-52]